MIGKVSDTFFKRAILPNLGAAAPALSVGAAMGVDAGVLKVGDEFLVIAEDPIFPVPGLSHRDFGWFTVHIGASDVAVLGVEPRYMTYSLLLPPGMPEAEVEEIISSVSETARELGITIVGGHTGYYPAVTIPTVGGITVFGFGNRVVTPQGAQVGDAVIITKGAAIEAAGLLASVYGEELREAGLSEATIREAAGLVYQMSVVKEARTAVRVGGVHAMHDATEGGVLRGLYEVAEASGVGLEINQADILLPPAAEAVCRHFGLDPYVAISEGTMVMTCAPEVAGEMLRAFEKEGIPAGVVGKVVPLAQRRRLRTSQGVLEIVPPEVDPFWPVFFGRLESAGGAAGAGGAAAAGAVPGAAGATPGAADVSRLDETRRRAWQDLKDAVDELKRINISRLIPEIRSNIAYAIPGAQDAGDVVAVPGRLIRYMNETVALGEPAFGASENLARLLLLVAGKFPEIRSVMNIRTSSALKEAVNRLGCTYDRFERTGKTDWREECHGGMLEILNRWERMPDIVEDAGGMYIEPDLLVFGRNPAEVVAKVRQLQDQVG